MLRPTRVDVPSRDTCFLGAGGRTQDAADLPADAQRPAGSFTTPSPESNATASGSVSVNFDPGSLVVSFIVSGAGFVLFSYGRKMQRIPQVLAGLILLVGPYFVPTILGTVLFGLGIGVLLYGALWYGV